VGEVNAPRLIGRAHKSQGVAISCRAKWSLCMMLVEVQTRLC